MKQLLVRTFVSALVVAGVSAQQGRDADFDVQLRTAMNLELVKGDLAGAIAEYRRIASAAGSSRAVAARALLQLAQSYDKLGDPEARPTYERITRDYADQRAIVS